ncbi:hypothetical protein AN216_11035 [Streptomyces oceani]|uniref:RNA polymerase subunit sigma-70 n=2 Tax=Streptomyces oceani TaxID=1075402 RepID=A0A1E7KI05_9ACTN|nr:hypothetical protein AN216_11035 [Streptomyces oceani]
MLGSVHDAEDAVQTAWLRAQAAGEDRIDNPAAWLTTVTTRICLDQLRVRQRRGELPLFADAIPEARVAADEDFLRRDEVSRALLVLLEQLTPTQRVSYVLHDLFSVPFDQIAGILDTTPANAKKLASRARARVQRPVSRGEATGIDARHQEIVAAFLDAARGGDVRRMLALLAPDCVRTADPVLLPTGAAATVVGANAVAEETRAFAHRIRATTTLRLNGRRVDVIAPGGHLLASVEAVVRGDRIVGLTIAPIRAGDVLTAL